MSTQEAPYGMVREGFKKNVDLSTFASDPHPPPYVEKKTKKTMLFFGLFSSFGTKKIHLENFSTSSI